MVGDFDFGEIVVGVSKGFGPFANVHVLGVHEETFVEAVQFLEKVGRHQHTGTADRWYLDRLLRIESSVGTPEPRLRKKFSEEIRV